jgi:hypothetical protein
MSHSFLFNILTPNKHITFLYICTQNKSLLFLNVQKHSFHCTNTVESTISQVMNQQSRHLIFLCPTAPQIATAYNKLNASCTQNVLYEVLHVNTSFN